MKENEKIFYVAGSLVLTVVSFLVLPVLIDKGATAIYRMLYTNEKDV